MEIKSKIWQASGSITAMELDDKRTWKSTGGCAYISASLASNVDAVESDDNEAGLQ